MQRSLTNNCSTFKAGQGATKPPKIASNPYPHIKQNKIKRKK